MKVIDRSNRIMFQTGQQQQRWVSIGCIMVVTVLAGNLVHGVNGAYQSMENVVLPANPISIQYDEGYIRKSGSIDFTELVFTTTPIIIGNDGVPLSTNKKLNKKYLPNNVDDWLNSYDDDFMNNDENDDDDVEGEDEHRPSYEDDDDNNDKNRRRRDRTLLSLLKPSKSRTTTATVNSNVTYVDIAIVPIPRSCSRDSGTCPWIELGIGKEAITTAYGNGTTTEIRWCCTDEAVELGLCTKQSSNQYGRLLIDTNKFKGQLRTVAIPFVDPMDPTETIVTVQMDDTTKSNDNNNNNDPIVTIDHGSQTFVVIYANCAASVTMERDVIVHGITKWKSQHGYLPGELYGFSIFYRFVTYIYITLLVWYGYHMKQNASTRIELEYYIIGAISIGCIELLFRTIDYCIWNQLGVRSIIIIWIGIVCGVMKQGVSRCVLVMVCMGYSVSRNTIEYYQKYMILGFGILYIVITTTSDCILAIATKNITVYSYQREMILLDTATILGIIQTIVNSGFVMVMFLSLRTTLQHLQRIGATKKYTRTNQLRYLIVTAATISTIAYAVLWYFEHYGTNNEDDSATTILAEEQAWLKDSITEWTYLMVLIGIAYLWKPHEQAYEYTYLQQKKLDKATATSSSIKKSRYNKGATTGRNISSNSNGSYNSDETVAITDEESLTDDEEQQHQQQQENVVWKAPPNRQFLSTTKSIRSR